MAEDLTDLGTWRQVKAAREGEAGFAALWNAHAPMIWSVIRPMCRQGTEQRQLDEAEGWCSSLRMVLAAEVDRLDPGEPLPPQVGARLFQHLIPAFRGAWGPVPASFVPDARGVASLPAPVRLAWLAGLCFEVPDMVFAAEPDLMPGLEAARRAAGVRGAEGLAALRGRAVGAGLVLAPPPEILMLPPGERRRGAARQGWQQRLRRRWWAALAGLLLAGLLGTPLVGLVRERRDWQDAARLQAGLLAGELPPGFVRSDDPAALAQVLSGFFVAQGVDARLAEVPGLGAAGLRLEGGLWLVGGSPAVVLIYRDEAGRPWALQHHLRPDPGRLPAALSGAGALRAWSEGEVTVTGWRDATGLWIVGARAGEADVLAVAALARQLRGAP